ncbi:MAG: class I SAM-dependent methyltransferase, partial [Pseudomonadota bacterium]|nr:class I SAM-dependent methyltransferase [Pseudomonadota bacterium]
PAERAAPAERPQLDVPYVATMEEVVEVMLDLAEVGPSDHVIDLGSGDGRIIIAAARRGATGLGVDLDPARIEEARASARAAGVQDRVEFRVQDLFETPISDADVVAIYLLPEINLRLRPRFLSQLRPGARVVSHAFDMGDWRPDRTAEVEGAKVFLWIVPARVEGRWTLTDPFGENYDLRIEQRYQEIAGSVDTNGRARQITDARLIGDRIRFTADLGAGPRQFQGRIVGNHVELTGATSAWRISRAG